LQESPIEVKSLDIEKIPDGVGQKSLDKKNKDNGNDNARQGGSSDGVSNKKAKQDEFMVMIM
jgi:hypothetical protein